MILELHERVRGAAVVAFEVVDREVEYLAHVGAAGVSDHRGIKAFFELAAQPGDAPLSVLRQRTRCGRC